MSNFICDKCGAIHYDLGVNGYRTNDDIELVKKHAILEECYKSLLHELNETTKEFLQTKLELLDENIGLKKKIKELEEKIEEFENDKS